MKVSQRQKKILKILHNNGTVSVPELTMLLNVSPATIRRDLEQLEQENSLKRTHGGAVDLLKVGYEPPYNERMQNSPAEKTAIALAVSRLIKPGDIVAIDAGTTTTETARKLVDTTPLTVITPSLAVAQIFSAADRDDITVIMPGGILRSKTQSLVGTECADGLRSYHYNKAILTCQAINFNQGAMNTNILALDAKKAIVNTSQQVIIVADHTKFYNSGLATFAPCDKIDTIVTDWKTPETILEPFRSFGIEIIIAQETDA
jgi:DeoR family fructose operon transcriptional repressor